MTLNYECVRELILWIEKNQKIKANGIPKPIKMKNIYSEFSYSKEDLNTAAQYLVDENALALTQDPAPESPKWFVFRDITSKGRKYIASVKDDTVWGRVKAALGPAAQASIPAILEIGTRFL